MSFMIFLKNYERERERERKREREREREVDNKNKQWHTTRINDMKAQNNIFKKKNF